MSLVARKNRFSLPCIYELTSYIDFTLLNFFVFLSIFGLRGFAFFGSRFCGYNSSMRLTRGFFERDVLKVAPSMLGKLLVVRKSGKLEKRLITEVEAYRGEEDLASHARFGKTKRNQIMYATAGVIYVYLVYGIYWMLNVVTGQEGDPQAVLIRGLDGIKGPGRVGKLLGIDKSFYGEDLTKSERIWIEETSGKIDRKILRLPRVGVDYAGDWAKKKWRFMLDQF